jgi:protein SCO1/2
MRAIWLTIAAAATLAGASPVSQEASYGTGASEWFTDVPLVTQNGDTLRLYTDLLKDKVVVINQFFGTCDGACPRMAGMLAGLQERLGDAFGKDVFFLSFSVDPETDTPAKLKQYAADLRAKPGWLFLTGKKENVEFALSRIGKKFAKKEDHLTVFLVGNNRTGLWKGTLAAGATVDSLKTVVDSVLANKD